MQFTTLLTTATLSALCLAAPLVARSDAVSAVPADAPEWTLQSFTRTCSADLTFCNYHYNISTGTGAATPCSYNITGNPATQTNVPVTQCGVFQVSSGWSGQFGPGNGFTTVAVTNEQLIAYPAYTDAELKNGTAVSPDRSYPAQSLPSK